jgi:hypothetical protein
MLFLLPAGTYAQQETTWNKHQYNLSNFYRQDVDSAAQEPTTDAAAKLDKMVTLKTGTQKLIDVLRSIARQSGLKLSYSAQLIPITKQVHIKSTKLTAKKALSEALRGTNLEFVVSPSGQIMFLSKAEVKQETVTGVVTDSVSGKPLIAVNIPTKGRL